MSVYRFRVGSQQLNLPGKNTTHVCLLINEDIFEYGLKEQEGQKYCRRREVGRENKYDWDHYGNNLNGTTYVSPDDLEKAIINSGEWGPYKYHVSHHNCHDFVVFCLRKLGCPDSMIIKHGPTFRHQNTITTPNTNSGIPMISPCANFMKFLDIKIVSAIDSNKVLDLAGGNVSNHTNIQIWDDCYGNKNQIWRLFKNDEDFSFSIRTSHNFNFAIDVSGSGTFDGNNIQLYEWNNTNAQKFYIFIDNEGRFEFLSKCNKNFAIDLKYSQTHNGNNIHLWSRNGSLAQKFYIKFVKN